MGDVYVQTRCGGSGRGGGYHVTTYSAWVAVTWDFAGSVATSSKLSAAPAGLDPSFSAVDSHGDQVHNAVTAVNVPPVNCTVGNTTYCSYRAYLDVVVPGAPTSVRADPAGGQFRVSWSPDPTATPLITSSTVTATPVGSTAPVVTVPVSGSNASAVIGPLEPQTTYQITVVSTDAAGSSPPSDPATLTTAVSAIPPGAPTGVAGRWTAPGTPGDTLLATWHAAAPGDSPTNRYRITVTDSDGGGAFTQTVGGSMRHASFDVSDVPDWTIRVRAHDAAGWGPWSARARLGGT
ncbi:MAG: fibronectin type III domain-containing protein [Solirubrobacterales bacterium]